MRQGLSMRELQKLSAGAIQALPHAVPVKNGEETVALLLPVRGLPAETVERTLADIRHAQAGWTAADRTGLDAHLAARGADP